MSRPGKAHAKRHIPAGSIGMASAIAASANHTGTGYVGDPEYRLLTLRDRWLTVRVDLNRLLDTQRAVEERGEEVKPDLNDAITTAHEEEDDLLGIIAIEPARTMRGLAVKVEASASRQHGEHRLVGSIMRDVLMLGALATTVTGSAGTPAINLEHPDDDLLALIPEWEASVAREHMADRATDVPGGGSAEANAILQHLSQENSELSRRIAVMPARTWEGVTFKARVALWQRLNTVADLERAVREDVQGCDNESQDTNALLLDILRLGGVTSAAPAVAA